MQPSTADAPRPRLTITVLVVVSALLLWGVILVEFMYAAPAAMRVSQELKRQHNWLMRTFAPVALRLGDYPPALLIPVAPAAVLLGGPTWWIRHRLKSRRLAAAWCVAMLLVPLLLATVIWFGTMVPLAEQMRELDDRKAHHVERLRRSRRPPFLGPFVVRAGILVQPGGKQLA